MDQNLGGKSFLLKKLALLKRLLSHFYVSYYIMQYNIIFGIFNNGFARLAKETNISNPATN